MNLKRMYSQGLCLLQRATCLFLAIYLSGCGSLHVDIDVYKGPLANEDRVQMQQVAAMAIGAKPLIDQLKEDLNDDRDAQELLFQILGLYLDLSEIEESTRRMKELIESGASVQRAFIGSLERKGFIQREEGQLIALPKEKENKWYLDDDEEFSRANKQRLNSLYAYILEGLTLIPDLPFENGMSRSRTLDLVAEAAAGITFFKNLERLSSDKQVLDDSEKKKFYSSAFLDLSSKINLGHEQHDGKLCGACIENIERTKNYLMAAPKAHGQEMLHWLKVLEASPSYREEYLSYWGIDIDALNSSLEHMALASAEIRQAIRKGFHGGRLDSGIESMITEYLNEADKDYHSEETQEAKDALLDALVRFSEKVVFATNRSVLIESGKGKAKASFIPSSVRSKSYRTDESSNSDRNKTTRVLQAVGYAIQNEVDAIRYKERHHEKQREQLAANKTSYENVYLTRDPGRILEDISQAIERQLADATSREAQLKKAYGEKEKDYAVAAKGSDLGITPKSDATNDQRIQDGEKVQGLIIKVESEMAPRILLHQLISGEGLPEIPEAKLSLHKVQKAAQPTTDHDKPQKHVEAIYQAIETELKKPTWTDAGIAEVKAAIEYLNTDIKSELGSGTEPDSPKARAKVEATVKSHNEAALKKKERAAKLKAAYDELIAAYAEHKKGTESVTAYEAALTQLKTLLPKLKKEFIAKSLKPSANSVREFLISEIGDEISFKEAERDAAVGDKKEPINDIIDALKFAKTEVRKVPQHNPVSMDSLPEKATARDVLDQLITTLRFEYLNAVSKGGKTSPQAVKYAQALDAAYKQRADQGFIHSPMHYLRSSYTVSELSDNNRGRWPNMLAPTWPPSRNSELAKMFNELDSQSWQTINTVMLRGGGDTNYVVAKDGIGNWYVKSYDADTAVVTESAKKLALFAGGIGPAADAIKRLDQLAKAQQNIAKAGGDPNDTKLIDAELKKLGIEPEEVGVRGQQLKASRSTLAKDLLAIAKDAESRMNRYIATHRNLIKDQVATDSATTPYKELDETLEEIGAEIEAFKKSETLDRSDQAVIVHYLNTLKDYKGRLENVIQKNGGSQTLEADMAPLINVYRSIAEPYGQALQSARSRLQVISSGLN